MCIVYQARAELRVRISKSALKFSDSLRNAVVRRILLALRATQLSLFLVCVYQICIMTLRGKRSSPVYGEHRPPDRETGRNIRRM